MTTEQEPPAATAQPTAEEFNAQKARQDSTVDVLNQLGQWLQKLGHGGQVSLGVASVIVNELGEGQVICHPDVFAQNPHIVQAAQNLAQVINLSRPRRQPQPILGNPSPPAAAPNGTPAPVPGPIKPERKRRKR